MKKGYLLFMILITISTCLVKVKAQVREPDFIGEAYSLVSDNSFIQLDKEIGDLTNGVSLSSNSWNALSLEVTGGKAQTRFSSSELLQLVVRAVDNNSDPLAIISIYKFRAKPKTRSVVIEEDNSGTLMKSRTNSKDMVRFSGKKYGITSYLISLK
jgi:ribosomal protein S6E (S10)